MVSCPVCQSTDLYAFLSRKNVPVHQHYLMNSEEKAILINRGDLDLVNCKRCSFIFNSSFDFSKLNYNSDYNNSQAFSPFFQKYTKDLASYIIDKKRASSRTVVEIGCGKGDFLRLLIESDDSLIGYGFDPSFEEDEDNNTSNNNRLSFIKDFYGPKYANVEADIIVCRHVIEHISNPGELLQPIKEAIKNAPNAQIYFETPCVEWILKNNIICDFFYEHCSYFTKASLCTAFIENGFKINNIEHVFGEQYLLLEASPGNSMILPRNYSDNTKLVQQYMNAEGTILQKLFQEIDELSLKGRCALWGAGAKGVTFANLIDNDRKRLDCVVDLNPNKQGKFLPGTGHAIVHFDELLKRSIEAIIVLNPNYEGEIQRLLDEHNISVQIITLDSFII